ncbi:MAG: type II secretion system major pseudopilin GspG [Deltaproteobacteria bacterium]|nr:type II secretion system major pseudopilin GspG [Deltaproteobacteria bacterium]
MKEEKKRLNNKGFTLIEILVVLIILSVLAALVAPRFLGRTDEAKIEAARIQIKNFEGALKLFYLDNGFYPSTEQGLEALVTKPTTGKIPKKYKENGYLEGGRLPHDPWDNDFVYLSPGINNKEYDIESYGADGEDGGEGNDADIESWNVR